MPNRVIWKYAVKNYWFTAKIPAGSTFLSVQVQAGQPQMWWLVDPNAVPEQRHFAAISTGRPFDPEGLVYLGTFQIFEGNQVSHLFEGVEKVNDVR